MRNERGMILMIVVISAFVAALAAYTIMIMSLGEARNTQFWRTRMRARYAAEAGLIWAQERMWDDPNFCLGSPTLDLDTDGDAVVDATVTITCVGGAQKTLSAQVEVRI